MKSDYLTQIDTERLPRHIAVIMDGNGRWASERGLKRLEGHRAGSETVDRLLDTILELKIPYVSLYAFSTENWKRPQTEIKGLFSLLDEYIGSKLPKMLSEGIKLHISGNISKLPAKSRKMIHDAIEKTADGTNLTANFCINYGSIDEILKAATEAARARSESKNLKNKFRKPLTEKELKSFLYTADLPDVDLLIRTAGEKRLSNFMLIQAAYAELYFAGVNWPDFDRDELLKSIIDYQSRHRKFGGL